MARTAMLAVFCGTVALSTAACLIKETTETWYVGPAGEVTWVITDKDVRSDANTATDRRQEESEYWLAVQQQRHPPAAGLMELGGTKVRTLALRSEPPFTVQTDAHFTGLDELGRRLLGAVGMTGSSVMTRVDATWDWKMVVRDPNALMTAGEPSEGINALVGGFEKLRVVLTAGHFESAEGFTISSDRRIAEFVTRDDAARDKPEEPTFTLRLVWK